MLISDEEDDLDASATFEIFHIKPRRLSTRFMCLPDSWCLNGMVVSLKNANSKQRLQFFLPIYEPERYAEVVERTGVIPAFFCGSQKLVWVFHEKKTRAQCITLLDHYLLKCLRSGIYSHWSEFPGLPMGRPQRCMLGTFNTVHCWTDKLQWSEFESIVFKLSEPLQQNYSDIQHFLRCGKNNIYSIWKPGEVPREVIERYGIKEEVLHFEDQIGNENESGAIQETG
jgi:hypothetical protein